MEDLRARGVPEGETRRPLAEELGDLEATQRELRDIGRRPTRSRSRKRYWEQTRADLWYAVRGLRAAPLFTAGIVITLAAGIGASGLMYGVMRQLLLQPPPHVAAPDRVRKAYFRLEVGDSARVFDQTSYPVFEQVQRGAQLAGSAIETAAAYDGAATVVVGYGAGAQTARATFVSAGFWKTLGVRPALGSFIEDAEAHPATGARVVVLSDAFWRRRFGGDPSVVGTTLQVRGRPYVVIGIAPRGFRGAELSDTDVWLPLFARGDGEEGSARWHEFASSSILSLVVRARPGASWARVAGELTRAEELAFDGLSRRTARQAGPSVKVVTMSLTGALGADGRRIREGTVSIWLLGVALVLLVVACANVAGLLLLRALRRRHELAIRLALGMGRARLASMLLAESVLLAALGGAAATAVVALGGVWVRRVLLPGLLGEWRGIDGHVLGASALAAAATGLLTGVLPMLQARSDAAHWLRDGTPHAATRRTRGHTVLLMAQAALSVFLLTGAGLFLRSLKRVTTVDLGFDAVHTHVVAVDLSVSGYTPAEAAAFHERALERLRALPGVTAASLASGAPLGAARGTILRTSRGGERVRGVRGSTPLVNYVADEHLDATGMRLLSGRAIGAADRSGPPVIVVNEELARLAWPGQPAIGQCAYLSAAPDVCTRVVGVARNARTWRLRETQQLWIYAPLPPTETVDRVLLVRVAPGQPPFANSIRRALGELNPALPYVEVRTLGDVLDPQYRTWRMGAAVFTAYGMLAVCLAALGLYSAMGYSVTQRTREMGVRLALGATSSSVVALVLGDGLRIAAAGAGAGVALAVAASPWLAGLLWDTSPRDPVVLSVATTVMFIAAVAAGASPAYRATTVSPAEALRTD